MVNRQGGTQGSNDGQHERGGNPRVYVSVLGPVDQIRRLEQVHLDTIHPGPERQEGKKRRREQRQMTPRTRRHPHP